MSETWIVVAAVGAFTMVFKAAGPVVLGARPLPPRMASIVELLAPALLAALVVTQTVGAGAAVKVDARLVGVAAAAVAIWRGASLLPVIVVAAAAAAIARALT